MILRYRPIRLWPGKLRDHDDRVPAQFSASWDAGERSTLRHLEREAAALDCEEVVIELALHDRDVRADGSLVHRGGRAATPEHPGVIVNLLGTRHGDLRLWTDRFVAGYRGSRDDWRANVRAVALGLEALRKVDRYGVAERGEQFTGFAALPPARPMGMSSSMTVDEASRLLGVPVGTPRRVVDAAFREASKGKHPDQGGDRAEFERLAMARNLLANLP